MTTEASEVSSPESENQKKPGLAIRVPASVANLGPGFETIAIAVKQYLKVTVQVRPPQKGHGPKITTVGPLASQLATDNSNLIAKVLAAVWPQDPMLLSCLDLSIESEINPSVGLGFSAAATTVGVTAAMALGGIQLEKGRIFSEAAKLENNTASAGASIFGGFMICAPNIVPGDILARKLIWPETWKLIALIPPYTIPAKKLRGAMPASISHKDAIYNIQKMALLIEAVAAADTESMKAALRDKLHEPYKAKLVPELAEIRKLLADYETLGTVISGNGPCLLTIVQEDRAQTVLEILKKWSSAQKQPSQIFTLDIDEEGLVVAD